MKILYQILFPALETETGNEDKLRETYGATTINYTNSPNSLTTTLVCGLDDAPKMTAWITMQLCSSRKMVSKLRSIMDTVAPMKESSGRMKLIDPTPSSSK